MPSSKKITAVVGTRPEIQKIIPVLLELKNIAINVSILYIPQRDNPEAILLLEKSKIPFLIAKKELPQKNSSLLEEILNKIKNTISPDTDAILIGGDTTTAVAGALYAKSKNSKLIKIGAGFRTKNFQMSEEKNDMIGDHLSNLLFAFSSEAKKNLILEGINEKSIVLSGSSLINSIHEALRGQHTAQDGNSKIIISLHRKSIIENKVLIKSLKKTLKSISKNYSFLEGLPYADFIKEIAKAKFVVTDSNTIAEECAFLMVPSILIGTYTSRNELIDIGAMIKVDPNDEQIILEKNLLKSYTDISKSKRAWKFPYGDLRTNTFIANNIANFLKR